MTKRNDNTPANRWSDYERYLKPEHIQGRKVTVKIAKVTVENTHPRPGKVERAPVLYFEGKSKGLILSATNRRVLARLFGDEIQACIGQSITLETVPVLVGRETKTPIRIGAVNTATVQLLQAVTA